MVFEIVCGILILFLIFGGADLIWFLFLDDTKPQTQEEWEDEHRKRGNISDKEWEKIQIKRGNIKQQ